MEISRKNYEIFFMDYLDGKLEGQEIDRFLDFVEQNPDLKEELAGIEGLKLPVEKVSFGNKNSLYKTGKQQPEAENFTAVAYMEGDLSELDRKLFLKHLEFHPEQAKEVDLLMKTRLQADETIVFPAKKKLYRRGFSKQLILWGSRVAAILLLAFAVWTVFNYNHCERIVSQPENFVLKNQEQKNSEEIIQKEKHEIAEVEIPLQTNIPTSKIKKEISKIVVSESAAQKTTPIPEREQETLDPIRPIFAQLEPVECTPEKELVANPAQNERENTKSEYYTIDSYLAEKVLRIKRSDKSESKSLIESGLDLAGNVSGNRLRYKTEEGKISKISFDTRLLAFSIPVKN